MQILKNRIVIGVACIILSLVICFAVTPLFNKSISEKTQIVRVAREIKKGDEITAAQVKLVEVGGYNLPEDVVRNTETAIGRYASADFAPGDYIIASKIADEPAAENAYLYSLNGEKQAMSVTVKDHRAGSQVKEAGHGRRKDCIYRVPLCGGHRRERAVCESGLQAGNGAWRHPGSGPPFVPADAG